MMLKIAIESADLIKRNKRDDQNVIYYMQEAWVYLYGPSGVHPHPTRLLIFPPKVDGAVVPYAPGDYALSPNSFGVRNGRFDVFVRLVPWAESLKQVRDQIVAEKKAA